MKRLMNGSSRPKLSLAFAGTTHPAFAGRRSPSLSGPELRSIVAGMIG